MSKLLNLIKFINSSDYNYGLRLQLTKDGPRVNEYLVDHVKSGQVWDESVFGWVDGF